MTQQLFFRVSSAWMSATNQGDDAKVFPVLSVEQNPEFPDYDKLVLDRGPDLKWEVFRFRGRFVKPFTLIIEQGEFKVARCTVEDSGTMRHLRAEFDTEKQGHDYAMELNRSLHIVKVVEHAPHVKPASEIRKGTHVKRMYANGLPMKKPYTMGEYDKASSKHALLDGKGGVVWIKPDTSLSVK